jgi:phosphoribosylformylglycinamidine (FGAM) synthase PurS component
VQARCFDYNSSTISDELLNAFQGKTIAGALDCIGGPASKICMDVVYKSAGAKIVVTMKPGFPDPPEGVTIKAVFGTTIKDNQVGKVIYEEFLPKALKAKKDLLINHQLHILNGSWEDDTGEDTR